MLYLNARSIVNKSHLLKPILDAATYDVIFITETWLNENFPNSLLCDLNNYCVLPHDREGQRGGGAAVLYKASLSNFITTVDNQTIHTNGFQ